jgi:parallel beta-helix repeat protein
MEVAMQATRIVGIGLIVAMGWPAGLAFGATLTVGGTDSDFTSIQAAVDTASKGDTIVVRAGTYREHVDVGKALILQAEGAVVIDAGKTGSAVTLAGSGIAFSGFEVRNAGSTSPEAGLLVTGDENIVSHVRATGNNWGIVISGGRGNTVSESVATSNRHDGIALLGAIGTTVSKNELTANNRAGLRVEAEHVGGAVQEAAENVVMENTASGNRNFGIAFNSGAVRNQVTGNTVEKNGRTVADAGILVNCGPNGNLIENNVVTGNQKHGILVMSGSFANRILSNRVSGSATGIGVYDANANEFAGNEVSESADYGIRLDDMAPLMPGAGDASGMFPVSAQNVLHHNDLTSNRVNAFDRSGKPWTPPGAVAMPAALLESVGQMLAPNRWDDGKEGNHYDDFDEEREGFLDRNGDSIGDAAHAIPGGTAVDNFPLAETPTGR